jgi:hypothetical protein
MVPPRSSQVITRWRETRNPLGWRTWHLNVHRFNTAKARPHNITGIGPSASEPWPIISHFLNSSSPASSNVCRRRLSRSREWPSSMRRGCAGSKPLAGADLVSVIPRDELTASLTHVDADGDPALPAINVRHGAWPRILFRRINANKIPDSPYFDRRIHAASYALPSRVRRSAWNWRPCNRMARAVPAEKWLARNGRKP